MLVMLRSSWIVFGLSLLTVAGLLVGFFYTDLIWDFKNDSAQQQQQNYEQHEKQQRENYEETTRLLNQRFLEIDEQGKDLSDTLEWMKNELSRLKSDVQALPSTFAKLLLESQSQTPTERPNRTRKTRTRATPAAGTRTPAPTPAKQDTSPCFQHKLLILSKQRSGTHFLRSLIDNHPRSKSTKEIFRAVELLASSFKETFIKQNFTLTESQYIDYLQKYTEGRNSFVLQATQLVRHQELLAILKKLNYSAVHLARRDILKMVISDHVRAYTEQSVCSASKPCVGNASSIIELPVEMLLHELSAIEDYQNLNRKALNESGMEWIEVYYEDMVNNNTIACDVLQFMGCDCPAGLTSKVQQINKRTRIADMISNYEQVKELLIGTKYEIFLDRQQDEVESHRQQQLQH